MKDYTSDGEVRVPVMLTEKELDFLHELIDTALEKEADEHAEAVMEHEGAPPEPHAE